MVTIGTVRGSEITTNKDADENTRILQVEITNAEDLQSIEQVSQSGEDSNPQPGSRVIVIDLGPSYRVAIATDDGIEPTVAEGEKELYSYDDALAKKASIKLLADGTVKLNEGNDYAARFFDLQSGFNDLVSQVQAELAKISTAIAGVGGAYSAGTLDASIDAALVQKVRLP